MTLLEARQSATVALRALRAEALLVCRTDEQRARVEAQHAAALRCADAEVLAALLERPASPEVQT